MSSGAFNLPKEVLPTIEPVGDALLIKMVVQGDKVSSESTLYRPEVAKMENFFGRVERVGPGRALYSEADGEISIVNGPMPVKEGDDILFHRYHGERIDFDGRVYCMLTAADILSKLDLTPALDKGLIRWAEPNDDIDGTMEAAHRFRGVI